MTDSTTPHFLVFQIAPDAGEPVLSEVPALERLIASADGQVLASTGDIDALEPGSTPFTTVISKWAEQAALDRFWQSVQGAGEIATLISDSHTRALAMEGLPEDGMPGDPLPTSASVDMNQYSGSPAYMIIDGEAYDEQRLLAYREIIFQLMLDRHSYYLVITTGDNVRVLKGHWDEKIFAISRWPSIEAGRDFWYCDKYQKEAIPIRTGAGHFGVNFFGGRV